MQPSEWQSPVEAFPLGFNQGDSYYMQNQGYPYAPEENREQVEGNNGQDMRIFPFYRPFYRPFFYPHPFYGGFYPWGWGGGYGGWGGGWGGWGSPYWRPYSWWW